MSSSASYLDHRFRQKVGNALRDVRRILDTTRNPTFAGDEQDHKYDDKYKLAEFVVNTGICAHANALERLGLDRENLEKLRNAAVLGERTVTLCLEGSVKCEFDREKSVKVESPGTHVTNIEESGEGDGEGGKSGGIFGKSKKTVFQHKVVTTVKEYHWNVTTEHALFVFAGSDPKHETSGRADLLGRKSTQSIITTGDRQAPPFLPHKTFPPISVEISWLLKHLSPDGRESAFSIDRMPDTCKTPRRNKDAEAALAFSGAFERWSQAVKSHFVQKIGRELLGKHNPAKFDPKSQTMRNPLGGVDANDIFVPVLPLFEASKPKKGSSIGGDVEVLEEDAGNGSTSPKNLVSLALPWDHDDQGPPLLSLGDVNLFLAEQCRGLDKKLSSLKTEFPAEDATDKLISCQEATITLLSDHMVAVSQHVRGGTDCIGDMLRSQLVAAIGKEIKPSDFAEFMKFHNPKLFKAEYSPQPFCFAIRRPNHYPDGVLSIEGADKDGEDGKTAPVATILRKFDGQGMPPMRIPLNAATSVEVTGPRHLHAWVNQTFAGQPDTKNAGAFSLTARARQFSCFVLMVGKIMGPDKFDPEAAIILQNKDEVLIPLLLTPLPSAKEFKDAIASLSPEQQRFAKAFRNMQLESSVFGACVVQLKPQLEALLGLPADALTKEIKLTQDLLLLFIEYQIPSDLVSYDGPSDASLREKVETVKKHAQAVLDMIGGEKKKQLEEAAQVTDMAAEKAFTAGLDLAADSSFANEACAATLPRSSYSKKRSFVTRGRKNLATAVSIPPPAASPFFDSAPPAPAMMMHEMLAVEDFDDGYKEGEGDFGFDQFGQGEKGEAMKVEKPAAGETGRPVDIKDDADEPHDMVVVDFTLIPKKLDSKFERLDDEAALCPTTIKTGPTWTKRAQATLLSKLKEAQLDNTQQKTEKDKAFDLLDALSRSGSLPIACAELHVIVAVTHCFEHSLISTVIEDNVNPIEKMEKSMLMIASTIHDLPPTALLKNSMQLDQVKRHAGNLFDVAPEGDVAAD